MAQADHINTTAPRPLSTTQEDPGDTLAARLIQARASVIAIQNTWDDKYGYDLPEKWLHEALWAVDELLAQGRDAFDAMLDERLAATAAERGKGDE